MEGLAAGRRLGVSEPSCRDDLGSQELDSLAREALLAEAGERRSVVPGNTKPDQPPVGVHPVPGTPSYVVNPVVHLEHSALGSTRRRSYCRQPEEALVEDEGAHGERRCADHRDECDHREHHEKPTPTLPERARVPEPPMALPSAHPADDISPVAGERRGCQRGEPSGEQIVFVRAHAITS